MLKFLGTLLVAAVVLGIVGLLVALVVLQSRRMPVQQRAPNQERPPAGDQPAGGDQPAPAPIPRRGLGLYRWLAVGISTLLLFALIGGGLWLFWPSGSAPLPGPMGGTPPSSQPPAPAQPAPTVTPPPVVTPAPSQAPPPAPPPRPTERCNAIDPCRVIAGSTASLAPTARTASQIVSIDNCRGQRYDETIGDKVLVVNEGSGNRYCGLQSWKFHGRMVVEVLPRQSATPIKWIVRPGHEHVLTGATLLRAWALPGFEGRLELITAP